MPEDHQNPPPLMPPPTGNLDVWSKWCQTPTPFAKPTKIGAREFTSISPYWQFFKATEQFGPVGVGWGWEEPEWGELFASTPKFHLLTLKLKVWAVMPDPFPADPRFCSVQQGDQRITKAVLHMTNSMKWFFKDGTVLDEDAHKKLLTDTLTKAFSYWGCSADVFTGCYDDHRYVQQMEQKEREFGIVDPAAPKTRQEQPATKPATDTRPAGQENRPQTAEKPASANPGTPGGGSNAPAPPSLPAPGQKLTDHGIQYTEMVSHAVAMGMTSQDVKDYLKSSGFSVLKDAPIPWMKQVNLRIQQNAKIYATILHSLTEAAHGNEQAAKLHMAVMLEAGNINLLSIDGVTLLTKTTGKEK